MKQLFALCSGFGLDLVDDFLELLRRQFRLARGFVFKNLHGEASEHSIGMRQTEDFGVVGIPKRRRWIVPEDEPSSIRQFVEPTNRGNEQIRNLREPELKS